MLVSDIVKTALSLVGREDAAEALEGQAYLDDAELLHAVRAMLYCVNATEDELARGTFPLVREDALTAVGGRIYYTEFTRTPAKIISVKRGNRDVAYVLCPEYLETEGKGLTVKYMYCPEKKELADESDYDGYPVGERLMAYGAASEYCLIEGAFEEAENWEQRYREEVERARPRERCGYIPARVWQ